MRIRPVTRTPIEVKVRSQDGKEVVPDAEVLASTFLFLPAPGLEDGWGFPDLQRLPANNGAGTRVDLVSGFRNRITARAPGWTESHTDLREPPSGPVTLKLRPLNWKPMRFEVLDEKRGTPVEGAWITLEEPRRGLPPAPNGFAGVTGADGLTPPMSIPDLVPLVIQIRAPGHRDRREALNWSSIGEGDIRTVWIRRKGWFE
ncbi:MAG: hypothetical protein ACKODA_10340, partial [Nevskiaceae bacterium]